MKSKSPEYQREWRKNNPEKAKAYWQKWYQNNKHKERERRRSILYGMKEGEFDQMCEAQGQCCAACNEPFGEDKRAVEHCHGCGCIRGAVHLKCNTSMGSAGDDPEKLRRLAEYLEGHTCR